MVLAHPLATGALLYVNDVLALQAPPDGASANDRGCD